MLETTLAKVLVLAGMDINYHFGDNRELINFLSYKDKQKSTRLAKGDINSIKKYPLLWLVVGESSPLKSLYYNDQSEINYSHVKFIISVNTNYEWLNPMRWESSMAQLESIENDLFNLFRGGKYIRKGMVWESYKVPNISINEDSSKAYDYWDALIINTDLIINNNCKI